jgi:hypothetical protein
MTARKSKKEAGAKPLPVLVSENNDKYHILIKKPGNLDRDGRVDSLP